MIKDFGSMEVFMRPFIANDVTTEIYIGKNAGQRINNELKKQKKMSGLFLLFYPVI